MRWIPIVAGGLLAGCDSVATGRFVLSAADPATCAARCVTTLELTVQEISRSVSGACEDELVLSGLPLDQPLTMRIVATSGDGETQALAEVGPLTLTADEPVVAQSVVLTPTAVPVLTQAEPPAPLVRMAGVEAVTLSGSGLGPGVTVSLDGHALEVVASAADGTSAVVLLGDAPGKELVATRCGVSSAPLAYEVIPIPVSFTPFSVCSGGRAVGGAPWGARSDAVFTVACPTDDACTGGTTLQRLGVMCRPTEVARLDGCDPLPISIGPREATWYQGTRVPGQIWALAGTEVPSDAWVPLSLADGETLLAVHAQYTFALYISRQGDGHARIMAATPQGNSPLGAPWDEMVAFDVDGVHLLAREDGVVRVIESSLTHPATPRKRWQLDGCETPRSVALERVWLDGEWKGGDGIVALCDGSAGARLFTMSRTGGEAVRSLPLPGLHPTDLALTTGRRDAWLWDPAGTLVVVMPESLREIGRWSLGPSFEGAALTPFPHSDDLILGGPALGQVTLIGADTRGPPRCVSQDPR